jgi:hypothetical protein
MSKNKNKDVFIPGRKGQMTRLVDGYLQRVETKTVVARAGHQCGKGELMGKPVTIDGHVIGVVTSFKPAKDRVVEPIYTMEIDARHMERLFSRVTETVPMTSMGCYVADPEKNCPVCEKAATSDEEPELP